MKMRYIFHNMYGKPGNSCLRAIFGKGGNRVVMQHIDVSCCFLVSGHTIVIFTFLSETDHMPSCLTPKLNTDYQNFKLLGSVTTNVQSSGNCTCWLFSEFGSRRINFS